jgi:hypothetical protein
VGWGIKRLCIFVETLKPRNMKKKQPEINIKNFAYEIVFNDLHHQVARMPVLALKRSTLTLMVGELVPNILNNTSRYNDEDLREYKRYKQAIIKEIVKQLLNVI